MITGKKKWSCNKINFTKKEAEQALEKNKHSSKQYRKECRTYYCDFHNAWHLTSEEEEEEVKLEIKFKKEWRRLLRNQWLT